MPKRILMDMICLSLELPQGLNKSVYVKVRRILRSKRFRTKLREAVGEVLGRFPSLRSTQLSID